MTAAADLYMHLRSRTRSGEGDRLLTDRTISHDEAREAAQRLINSHFGNKPDARATVPAERDHDDDMVICAYIAQRSAVDVPWLSYDWTSDVLTIDGCRIARGLLQQITTSECGVRFAIMSRDDGVVTVRLERNPLEAAAPELLAACKAALAYDIAIQTCGNDPEKMASFCTAQGDDLDALYRDWITKAREAVASAERAP